MNREFTITACKTYATKENAVKAVAKTGDETFRHFYMTDENGRWFPVFTGMEAIENGVHFRWNVIG
jgi:hypothetical protein